MAIFTDRRLWAAYRGADIEDFDESSKYIFFSDLHRGDDSASDEFTRNQVVLLHALRYYYHEGFTYVEAGDGDELWEYSDFKNIRLAHSDVFLAIKKFFDDRRLRLLYGNHNIYLRSDGYVKKNYFSYYDEFTQNTHGLFPGIKPKEALVLRSKATKQEILVVHGHQGDCLNDQLWPVSMILMRYFWRFLHVVGFQNPTSPAKNLYKRTKIEIKYKHWIEESGRAVICGHTHRPKFSEENELPYFNTGCCIHTKGITGIELEEGKIAMVNWEIKAEADGNLRVVRNVVRGPTALRDYAAAAHHPNSKEHPL